MGKREKERERKAWWCEAHDLIKSSKDQVRTRAALAMAQQADGEV